MVIGRTEQFTIGVKGAPNIGGYLMDIASQPAVENRQGEELHLARNLSNRHLQLIAIGGAIGTGLAIPTLLLRVKMFR